MSISVKLVSNYLNSRYLISISVALFQLVSNWHGITVELFYRCFLGVAEAPGKWHGITDELVWNYCRIDLSVFSWGGRGPLQRSRPGDKAPQTSLRAPRPRLHEEPIDIVVCGALVSPDGATSFP